ncbi:unnamed protein product, partial [Prorocentrum cordatum]
RPATRGSGPAACGPRGAPRPRPRCSGRPPRRSTASSQETRRCPGRRSGGARRCRQGAGPGRGPGGGRQGGGGGLAAEHRGRPLVRRPPRGAAAQPGPRERVPPRDGDPAWYPELNSSQACADWCRQHAACAEATFSRVGVPEGGEQCRLFEARGELYDFRDDFNASWCGALEEVDHLLWEVKKLFEQKPWVGDNYGAHPCSFGGDDCSQTRCCGTQTCDWSFTSCEYFQCVRKDEYYAGCTDAPEAGWDGEVLGGGPNEDDLPRAEEGKLVHPGSLFCFTVVMPGERSSAGVSESESALVETARETKSGIYSCDDQMVVDGWEDGGGSEANIDVFISYWKKVQNDGRYLLHDWLIKADADCVFVADRVKARFEIFRPPAGAAVYFRNTEFKFNFMGAFEMMSREGAQVFFAGAWQCDGKMDHKGGEDYWMRLCLDTLGLRYIADPSLLYDKYAAQNGCADERAAAFHFYKTPETYRECLAEISR